MTIATLKYDDCTSRDGWIRVKVTICLQGFMLNHAATSYNWSILCIFNTFSIEKFYGCATVTYGCTIVMDVCAIIMCGCAIVMLYVCIDISSITVYPFTGCLVE